MSTPVLNQSAPPAEAPKGGDFIKLEPFPRADSFVLTVTAFNFIASYPFERTDDKTKEEYIKEAPAIELFLSGLIDGKPYHCKTWPQQYSISDRANYRKWYTAIAGTAPAAGSNVADLLGKHALVAVEVLEKTGKRGGKYKTTKIVSIGKVPSLLAAECVPLEKLKPALEKALAEQGEEKNSGVPF